MAYSMCGVESRFCDDAMPIRSGSRIFPCAGVVSAVRTLDLRQSALLCQLCVREIRFPFSSLISGFASGTFLDETGLRGGEKLLCAAYAARNTAVSALQGTGVFCSVSAAEAGLSSTRRAPFTLTANASYRHRVRGSELRPHPLIFSGNCRTRRQSLSTFQEKGIRQCQTIVSQVMSCAVSPLSSISSSVSEICVASDRMGLSDTLQTVQPGQAGERGVTMFSLIATSLTVGAVKISTPTLIWAGAEIAKAIYRSSQED